jgi:hypothetical protein
MIMWMLASLAFAQQEKCGEPYSRIQFGAAVGQVDDAYRNNDVREAKAVLQKAGEDLRCHDEVIDRLLLSKFSRYMALQFFFDQDEEGAKRWGATAKAAGADLPYDARIFPTIFVELMNDLEEPLMGGPSSGLAVPPGGGIFVDGSLITAPVTAAEVPHLVQVFDKDQALLGAYWQTGAAFEAAVLGSDTNPKPPKWWTGDGASSARSRTTDDGNKSGGGGSFPVVPVVAAGGLLVASGASYFLASSAAGQLPNATTGQELTSARTQANAFVVVSGVCLAGAIGVGVGGVLVSHEGIVFHGRF